MSDYLGRYIQGDVVPLTLLCVDASNTPSLPTAAPSAIVYNDAGPVKQVKLPVLDRYLVTGLFRFPLLLDAAFSAGRHRVEFNYQIAGSSFLRTSEFEVLSSGAADGAAISAASMELPQVNFLVAAARSGRIKKMRNPKSV